MSDGSFAERFERHLAEKKTVAHIGRQVDAIAPTPSVTAVFGGMQRLVEERLRSVLTDALATTGLPESERARVIERVVREIAPVDLFGASE